MKLKDINLFERHIEKALFGIAAGFGLYVLWAYFLSNPYKVEYNNEAIPWNRVEERVANSVAPLRDAINRPDTPLPDLPAPDFSNTMPRIDPLEPVTDAPRLMALGGLPGVQVDVVDMPLPLIEQSAPPAPRILAISLSQAVMAGHDELVDYLMRNVPRNVDEAAAEAVANVQAEQVKTLAMNRETMDIQGVSLSAQLDVKGWHDLLKAAPEEHQVPLGRMHGIVADVRLERQELDPLTGEWGVNRDSNFVQGEFDIVDPMPGQTDFRGEDGKEQTSTEYVRLLEGIRTSQAEILSPEFVPLAKGVWADPQEKGKQLSPEEQRRLRQINERIERMTQQVRKMEEQLEKIKENEAERQQRMQQAQRADALRRQQMQERGGDNNRGGGARGSNRSTSERARELEQQRQQAAQQRDPVGDAQQQIDTINQNVDDLYLEKDELLGLIDKDDVEERKKARDAQRRAQRSASRNSGGYGGGGGGYPGGGMMGPGMMPGMMGPGMMPGMYPGGGMGPGFDQPRRRRVVRRPVFGEDGKLNITAHDLTGEPGKTYRYRVRVGMLNPLYHLENLQPEQRAEQYNKLMLYSEPSEWTDAIEIDKPQYFFVARATAQPLAATVEVFRFHDGQWYMNEFSVEPGGLIGGEVEIETEIIVADASGGEEERTETTELDMSLDQVAVDLIFPQATLGMSQSPTLVYLDLETNKLHERVISDDQKDATRNRLLNKIAESKITDEDRPRRRRRG